MRHLNEVWSLLFVSALNPYKAFLLWSSLLLQLLLCFTLIWFIISYNLCQLGSFGLDCCFIYANDVVFCLQQSRILKHAGDLAAAAAMADEARCMDLADRYINSECVKRMLQADKVTSVIIKTFIC